MASPRLRRVLVRRPEIRLVHRCFALAPDPRAIARIFGSAERGKDEILEHWRQANEHDDEHRFRPGLMATRPFPYPFSMPGLRACKAAEFLGGQAAHWDMFDRVQHAHLVECRNIADDAVLRDCAADIGLEIDAWDASYRDPVVYAAVLADLTRARQLGVAAVPTLVADGRFRLSGARTEAQYDVWLNAVAGERGADGR